MTLPAVEFPVHTSPKVSMPVSRKTISAALVLVAVFATVAWAGDRKAAKDQVDFGIKVASQGLWREAVYRWERAVELDPTYPAAFNNLAIAYEAQGQFEKAKDAYEKAIALDPKNQFIRQNFDLFKEINDRANRQDSR
jgi:Tfp pilus assembly protein PilF